MIKWAGSKRKTWVKKTDMNCYQLLLEFERKNGPKVLGKLHSIIIHMYLVYYLNFRSSAQSRITCFYWFLYRQVPKTNLMSCTWWSGMAIKRKSSFHHVSSLFHWLIFCNRKSSSKKTILLTNCKPVRFNRVMNIQWFVSCR